MPDLAAVTATVAGHLTASGEVQGQQTNLAVNTIVQGDVGTTGFPPTPVSMRLTLAGLPNAPSGDVTAQGSFAGAPLTLAASATRLPDGTVQADITKGSWKSAEISGHFTLPKGAVMPLGQAQLRMTRLADLRPVVGTDLAGSVAADLSLAQQDGRPLAKLLLTASGAGAAGGRVASAKLSATVTDPATDPVVAAQITVDGIEAGGVAGSARATITGPESALAIRLDANLPNLAGAPARINGTALVNATGKDLQLRVLQADWRGEPVRLLGQTRISFANGVSVDRLRIGVAQAVLDLSGRVSPTLDVNATLRNVTPALAKPFMPTLNAEGVVNAEARVTGTPAAPMGTIRVTATGIRMRSGPTAALPPASLTALLTLAGQSTRVNATLAAGSTHLTLTGTAPLRPTGAMDLRAAGAVDLAVTDPILTPNGQQLRGQVTLDATVAGTIAAPQLRGTVRLANGRIQDFALGALITDVNAEIVASGDTIRIARFTGRAGAGTIAASGTVGLRAPGMPVDLTLTARNAVPLQSDKLTASLDADLALRGDLAGALAASGSILIHRATINVPDKLPTSVAVLNVRVAGAPPPPPPAPAPTISLDITVKVGEAVFVRGHGIDAEFAGSLHLAGTTAALRPSGGLTMRHGTFSLAGTTLTFTKGNITFNGSGLYGKIDPSLDFVASSTTNAVTATLTVSGYASSPKFALSSVPQLPQDEVLSYLLFRQSAKNLGPFQYAAIAQALASLSGVGGGMASNPLGAVRQGLGLDRLSVSGGGNGTAPSVQGGRYIGNGIYVGAAQGTAGAGTQAQVEINLYRGLKLQSNVGASGSGGSNIGLTYQFQY
jgi:translocation and assembly module TamB